MSEFKVIDKDGVWVMNTGESRVPDYVRHAENPGTELIIIEPGIPTKIKLSDYLKAQPTLIEVSDPLGDDTPAKPKGEPKAKP